jgi:hypothetical protein
VQHSMENTLCLRYEESYGQMDILTPSDLISTVRSLKEYNERIMRAHVEKAELNLIILQSLSKIQKHLHQCIGTTVGEVENPFRCSKEWIDS